MKHALTARRASPVSGCNMFRGRRRRFETTLSRGEEGRHRIVKQRSAFWLRAAKEKYSMIAITV